MWLDFVPELLESDLAVEEHAHEDKARDSHNGEVSGDTNKKDDDSTCQPQGMMGE